MDTPLEPNDVHDAITAVQARLGELHDHFTRAYREINQALDDLQVKVEDAMPEDVLT